MRYGLRIGDDGEASAEDVMSVTRAVGFGAEVKRRIMLGTYALSSGYYDAYYGKAQQVRTLIIRDFDAAFEQVDVLVSPTTPTTAFPIGERADDPMAMYLADLCTIPSDLAGNAAMSVPCGLAPEDGLPVGFQIMAPVLADDRTLPGRGRRRGGSRPAARLSPADPGPRPGSCRRNPRQDHDNPRQHQAVPYDLAVGRYEPVIGLETHVELGTVTKMFCGSPVTFGAEPNSAVCPVCLGLPGSLPVINKTAIEYTIKIGLALNCSIATWCRFARKNYFYPDMPKNFQISQYDEPLCTEGWLKVEVDGQEFTIGIERVHLEEDTGKSQHVGGATGRIHGADVLAGRLQPGRDPAGRDRHQADPGHWRAGSGRGQGLRDRTARPAALARGLRRADGAGLAAVRRQHLDRPARHAEWGTRTETKNVNSLRSVERAVRSEIERQAGVLDAGGRVDPGDQALPRGHRRHHLGAQQGRGPGLPLFPRA